MGFEKFLIEKRIKLEIRKERIELVEMLDSDEYIDEDDIKEKVDRIKELQNIDYNGLSMRELVKLKDNEF